MSKLPRRPTPTSCSHEKRSAQFSGELSQNGEHANSLLPRFKRRALATIAKREKHATTERHLHEVGHTLRRRLRQQISFHDPPQHPAADAHCLLYRPTARHRAWY